MTLCRNRKSTSFIVLMVAVYASAFLLHDLNHSQLPLITDLPAGNQDSLSTQNDNGTGAGDSLLLPAQGDHHCPFCNGFTGSVAITPMPPPAEQSGRASVPPARPGHCLPWASPIARAPPLA